MKIFIFIRRIILLLMYSITNIDKFYIYYLTFEKKIKN